MGQKTATSPYGRSVLAGQPLRMAELVAQLDGPVYVERVALFDAKQRVKAQKAIKKALKLQVDRKGFAFVEVLAECPTHLKMDPLEAEKWVKESILPIILWIMASVEYLPEMKMAPMAPRPSATAIGTPKAINPPKIMSMVIPMALLPTCL